MQSISASYQYVYCHCLGYRCRKYFVRRRRGIDNNRKLFDYYMHMAYATTYAVLALMMLRLLIFSQSLSHFNK